MSLVITIDENTRPDELRAVHAAIAVLLADLEPVKADAAAAKDPEPKAAPAKKAAPAPKAKPAPEPAEEDTDDADLLGGDEQAATLEDATAAATKLISSGKAAKVKAALAAQGVKRVSEVTDFAGFIEALGN